MAAFGGGSSGGGGGGGGSDVGPSGTSFLLPYEELEWERDERGRLVELGRGASGAVYAGTFRGLPVALKEESVESALPAGPWLKVVRYSAACPHLARVYGAVMKSADASGPAAAFIVMERLAGSLAVLLLAPGAPHAASDVRIRLQWLADIAGALAFLHAAGVIHADVKPAHVLLTAPTPRVPTPEAKLAGFSALVRWQVRSTSAASHINPYQLGAPLYMDPELLDYSAAISTASDVYSFGIMAWQVLTGRVPLGDELALPANAEEAAELLAIYVCGPRGGRPPVAALVEAGVPPSVVALVAACWTPAARERPTMAVVQRALAAAVPASEAGPSDAMKASTSFLLSYDDLEWERDRRGNQVELGRGASGTVYAGSLRGQPVAIKKDSVEGAAEEEVWLKAVRLHKSATCPCIVSVHGAVIDRAEPTGAATYFVVMERLAGSLSLLLLKPGAVYAASDVRTRLLWLADVAGALAYLHAGGIIHADVKPDNVMLTAPTARAPVPVAKLADFGASVQRLAGDTSRATLRGERGTLLYMDPVLLDNSASISAASDVYSFGIMAWQVLARLVPYEELYAAARPANGVEAIKLLTAHVCGPRGSRPPLAVVVERGVPGVAALVAACWAPTAGARPTMAAVQRALEAEVRACGSGPLPSPVSAILPASAPASPAATSSSAVVPEAPAPAPLPTPAPVVAVAAAQPRAGVEYTWSDTAVLRGHTGAVCCLALLPDGRLASGDYSGSVLLWDPVRDGDAVTMLEGHAGWVRALAVLPVPGGCRLTAGVRKAGGIVLWDVTAAPPTRGIQVAVTRAELSVRVLALAALPDGRLAAGCNAGEVRVVDVVAAAVVATLKGHTGYVAALAVLLDGRLASGSDDQSVRVWELADRACVATLAGHAGGVRTLAVLRDGRLASGSDDNTVRLWEVDSGTCTAVLVGHTSFVWALAALPDGRLASGACDATIRLWDTRAAAGTGTGAGATSTACVATLAGHTSNIYALAALPGGRLASGSADMTVRLWKLPLPAATSTIPSAAAAGGACSTAVRASLFPAPLVARAPAPARLRVPGPAAAAAAAAEMAAIRRRAATEYVWSDEAVLRGHTGTVCSLALLPDCRLASGDNCGNVRLWNPARGGGAVAVVRGYAGWVRALAVLPGGRYLAAGVTNARAGVILWDATATLPTGGVPVPVPVAVTRGKDRVNVDALAALSDGRLAAGCIDGKIRVLDVESRAVVATLEGNSTPVSALAALPDGRLASGSADSSVLVWELASRVCVATLAGHTSGVCTLAVLPGGRLASGSEDRTVRLWELHTCTCIAVLTGHTNSVLALAALPDGHLASGSADNSIKLWNVRAATGTGTGAVATLVGHTNLILALAALPGGRLASASADKMVRLWELPLPEGARLATRTIPNEAPAAAAAGAASASPVLASVVPELVAAPAPAPAPAPTRQPRPAVAAAGVCDDAVLRGHAGAVSSLALLPDGRLASGDCNGTVRLWDPARGGDAVAVMKGHGGWVRALAVLCGGCNLAAGVTSAGGIVLWDTSATPPSRSVPVAAKRGKKGVSVLALAALPDGRLAAGCSEGKVRVVDIEAAAVAATLEGHTDFVAALAVLPYGRLASGSADRSVRVWELATGACVTTLTGHSGAVRALAVLLDGTLVSGSDDTTVRVWELGSGTCTVILVLAGHTSSVTALAALPDGRLASGSADNTIRLWDVRAALGTGIVAAVATLEGHTNWILALAALSDGRLASGAGDSTIRLWELPLPATAGSATRTVPGAAAAAAAAGGAGALPFHTPDLSALFAAPAPASTLLRAPGPTPATAAAVMWPTAATEYAWRDAAVLRGHTGAVCSLALLPDGRLASGDYSGNVRLWDLMRGGDAVGVMQGHAGWVRALAVLPGGCHVAAGVRRAGFIVLWDVTAPLPTRGVHIALTRGKRSVRVLALVALSDGWLAAGCTDGEVKVVDVEARAVVATLEGHTDFVAALAMLPDGRLVSGSDDMSVRVWELASRACVASLAGHTGGVHALAVLRGGHLASASTDKTVRLWEVGSCTCTAVLAGHTSYVCALAALPGGRLASGSCDGTIRLWNVRAAAGAGPGAIAITSVATLAGHTSYVYALAALPGGRLASASADKTVRLWELPRA